VLALGLVLTALSPVSLETAGAYSLSVEDETKLGRQFVMSIQRYYEFVEDDFAVQYINELGQYLLRPIETQFFPFRFYILKDYTMNAFAAPGGHLFFFSGLIEMTEEVDELAAVVCHEIGHITARHLAHRIEQQKKISWATMAGLLAAALVGGEAGAALMAGSLAAGQQASLAYSRENERQADQLEHKYMDAAGFDPAAMISTLNGLERGQWFASSRMPKYLLTHPTGPDRMANIEVMLTGYTPKPPTRETTRFKALFPYFRAVVRAKSMEPRDAERLFKLDLEKDPDSAVAHLGLGIVYRDQADFDRAIDHVNRALKKEPNSLLILQNLGEIYQVAGQDREAVEIFEKTLKIDHSNRAVAYLLAVSYQNQEEYKKAIRLYERLAAAGRAKNEVYYNLGMSYGRAGILGWAHYNFGIYFGRTGQMDKAQFHFEKAKEHAANDPRLQGKIQKALEGMKPQRQK
jgi:predicted Zn-dependent protease